MDDDFYITVNNSSNLGSNQFENQLYSQIKLPRNTYEVALSEIDFSLGSKRTFGSLKSDGKVEVEIGTDIGESIVLAKNTDDLKTWITESNVFLTALRNNCS